MKKIKLKVEEFLDEKYNDGIIKIKFVSECGKDVFIEIDLSDRLGCKDHFLDAYDPNEDDHNDLNYDVMYDVIDQIKNKLPKEFSFAYDKKGYCYAQIEEFLSENFLISESQI
ncbi:MAG: hypothetical protein ACRCXK_08565, partial [Wohlfahrtiimonas sp.]